MKLISTKIDPAEELNEISSPNEYGYGLCIELDADILEKLGLTDKLLEIGTEVNISGLGKVVRSSQSASEGSDDYQCISIQITDIGVEKSKTASQKLYGKS